MKPPSTQRSWSVGGELEGRGVREVEEKNEEERERARVGLDGSRDSEDCGCLEGRDRVEGDGDSWRGCCLSDRPRAGERGGRMDLGMAQERQLNKIQIDGCGSELVLGLKRRRRSKEEED